MKIRSGFVSNSSSTSFIVGLRKKKSEPCPHCGRSDPDFIDAYIERGNVNDTGLIIDGRFSSVIDSLNENIKEHQSSIKEYQMHRPQDSVGWGKSTYADMISYEESDIKEIEALIGKIEKIQNEGYTIHEIEISYHDGPARDKLQELVKTGSAVIINERG